MAEYLKNNPIALRHCLLYEFLQGKSVEEAFSDFCEAVGKYVIEKESFEFWFDKFFWGIFDDAIEPIADIKEALRSDKYALRVCILYEYLNCIIEEQKNKRILREIDVHMLRMYPELSTHKNDQLPVFAKYQNFCKVIGDGVMEYREFEFWFYRFANGEFDLNFERDTNQKIYELTDMPLDIMRNIVEYLNIFDRSAFAQCSSNIKRFVQKQKVSLEFLGFRSHDDFTVIHAIGNPSKFTKKLHYKGTNHLEEALLDFKNILLFKELEMNELDIRWPHDNRNLLADSMSSVTVRKLFLELSTPSTLLCIIGFLKPGYLTTISVNTPFIGNQAMDSLSKCEQWMNASSLELRKYIGNLRHLYHFKEFIVRLEQLSLENIREMKETLLDYPGFRNFTITLDNAIDFATVREEFGDAIHGHTHQYQIPNSTDYFELKIFEFEIRVTRKM